MCYKSYDKDPTLCVRHISQTQIDNQADCISLEVRIDKQSTTSLQPSFGILKASIYQQNYRNKTPNLDIRTNKYVDDLTNPVDEESIHKNRTNVILVAKHATNKR